jgi:hypothetical protein
VHSRAMLTALLRPQTEASMPGRQLPQDKTRSVAGPVDALCDDAIPASRSRSLAVVSASEMVLALQQRD